MICHSGWNQISYSMSDKGTKAYFAGDNYSPAVPIKVAPPLPFT